MTAVEEWRPVPGFPGYEVSSLGRVVSKRRRCPQILKPWLDSHGYPRVGLRTDDGRALRSVHVVVATAFLGPRPDGCEVRHLDGSPLNNTPENLAWGTRSENERDKVRHGTHNCASKTHCPKGHAYDEANTSFTPLGYRRCRACLRDFTARARARARLAA